MKLEDVRHLAVVRITGETLIVLRILTLVDMAARKVHYGMNGSLA